MECLLQAVRPRCRQCVPSDDECSRKQLRGETNCTFSCTEYGSQPVPVLSRHTVTSVQDSDQCGNKITTRKIPTPPRRRSGWSRTSR